jgi:dihydrolipoamide dehydrogenase
MDTILPSEDSDIADILARRLEADGVVIHAGTKALRARNESGKILLSLGPARDPGPELTIEAEALLVAAGRRPNTEGLALDMAGVHYTSRGIPANERMQTNVAHIYACGNVNGL